MGANGGKRYKILKYLASMFILWVALAALPTQAQANSYDESQSNSLRYVAYFLHPFGVAAEWTVMRPVHTMMSGHNSLEFFHGHNPHPPPLRTYAAHRRRRLKNLSHDGVVLPENKTRPGTHC